MVSAAWFDSSSMATPLGQATLCLGLGLAASFALSRRPARAHQVLLLAILMSVAAPAMTLVVGRLGLGVLPSNELAACLPATPSTALDADFAAAPGPSPDVESVALGEHNRATAASAVHPAQSQARQVLTSAPTAWLGWAWLSLSLIVAGRLAIVLVRGRRLLAASHPITSARLDQAARRAATLLRIAPPPELRAAPQVRCPMIWCWRQQPVLLLPGADDSGAANVDWLGVFCHELAHWKRRDHWVQLGIELFTCVLPWHPLIWCVRRRVQTLSERACDDWALTAGGNAAAYAESLLNLLPERRARLALAARPRQGLAGRIEHILRADRTEPRAGARWTLATSLAAVSMVAAASLAQPAPPQVSADAASVPPAIAATEPGPLSVIDARRIDLLLEQITQFELFVAQLDAVVEVYSAPDGVGLSPEDRQLIDESPAVASLFEAELRLDLELSARQAQVAEDHPDVKALRAQLETARQRLADERGRREQQIKDWKLSQIQTQHAEYQEALRVARLRLSELQGGQGDIDAQLAALNDADWRTAFSTGLALATLPPDLGFAKLRDRWDAITNVDARQQLLKAFYYSLPYPLRPRNHSHILKVLNLGATDRSPEVQSWALQYLRGIAFQDFTKDYAAYQAWFAIHGNRDPVEVQHEACRRFAATLAQASDSERADLVRLLVEIDTVFRDTPMLCQTALEAGLADALVAIANSDNRRVVPIATRILGYLSKDEEFLRRVMLPLAIGGQAEAVRALGVPGATWAVEPLEQLLVRALGSPRELQFLGPIASALDEIGDPRSIPTMIGVVAADDTEHSLYGLGYFGLARMTGVQYDPAHTGAWWVEWWAKNRERFGPEAAARPIPVVEKYVPPMGPPDEVIPQGDDGC